jgi:cytoskeletal protein CcmA (bactofilin family)
MIKRDFFGSENNGGFNKIIEGTEITGDIVSDSNIIVEGDVIGNISCSGKVIIGNTGKITGNLVCIDAEIEGTLEGELTIENLLVLRSTARITGDIETVRLAIEEGGFFEGACVMKKPGETSSRLLKNNAASQPNLEDED